MYGDHERGGRQQRLVYLHAKLRAQTDAGKKGIHGPFKASCRSLTFTEKSRRLARGLWYKSPVCVSVMRKRVFLTSGSGKVKGGEITLCQVDVEMCGDDDTPGKR